MRTFILVTSLDRFNEAPYLHGKALVASLLISNGIRHDAEFVMYLVDARMAVKVLGSAVRSLFPDEESSTGILRKALRGVRHPGVRVLKNVDLRELSRGILVDGRPGNCRVKGDFTYLAYLERLDIDVDCGSGLGDMPPHHQFAVINIEADRG
ncbi:hypothetical protein [Thermoproteus tenax]|uniref:hypothetical protein n=1 Tax=Thermoproteus tenax TaxID=2271 RepID=UPI000A80990C|nr:hypothetical protein [Thermoproteus tenax]